MGQNGGGEPGGASRPAEAPEPKPSSPTVEDLMNAYTKAMDRFHQIFPEGAIIIWGGFLILFGAAILNFITTNPNSQTPTAYSLLGFGVALYLIARLLGDPSILRLFRWVLLFFCLHWVALFDLHLAYPEHEELHCAAYIWKSCDEVLSKHSTRKTVNPATEPATSPTPPPPDAKIDVVPPPPPPPPQLPPDELARLKSSRKLYIQFAGTYTRDEMKIFAGKLRGDGWQVDDEGQGGQRTRTAAGYNEVRYAGDDFRAAAVLLAAEIDKLGLAGRKMKVVPSLGVAEGHLEIYLSN
jgi:hypothetical protein